MNIFQKHDNVDPKRKDIYLRQINKKVEYSMHQVGRSLMPNIYRNPASTKYLHYLMYISLKIVGIKKETGSNKRLERGGYYHDYIFILKIFIACIEVNCNVLFGFRQSDGHILERQQWRKDGDACLTVMLEFVFWSSKLMFFLKVSLIFEQGRIRVTQQYILKIHWQYFVNR